MQSLTSLWEKIFGKWTQSEFNQSPNTTRRKVTVTRTWPDATRCPGLQSSDNDDDIGVVLYTAGIYIWLYKHPVQLYTNIDWFPLNVSTATSYFLNLIPKSDSKTLTKDEFSYGAWEQLRANPRLRSSPRSLSQDSDMHPDNDEHKFTEHEQFSDGAM